MLTGYSDHENKNVRCVVWLIKCIYVDLSVRLLNCGWKEKKVNRKFNTDFEVQKSKPKPKSLNSLTLT